MTDTSIFEVDTRCSDIAFRSCTSELYINDIFIGYTPIQLFLPIGDYQYKIIKPGYIPPPAPPLPIIAGTAKIKYGARLTLAIDLVNPTVTGGWSVETSPVGAKIFIDDVDQNAVTPVIISRIPPGPRKFVITLPGYKEITGTCSMVLGQYNWRYIQLKQLEDFGTLYLYPIPYLYGKIILFITEGAKIYIDGIDTGKFLFSNFTGVTKELTSITGLTKGVHTFRVEKPGVIDIEGTFIINGGDVLLVGYHPILHPNTGILVMQVAPFIGNPKLANISIDGINMGETTGIRYMLPEGMHTYKLQLDGYEDVEGEFEIKKNRFTTVTAYMRHIYTIPLGKVNITSDPSGSSVLIDDIYLEEYTPVTIGNLSDGDYTYRLLQSGYEDATGTFTVTNGETVDLNVTLKQSDTILDIACNTMAAKIYIDDEDIDKTTPTKIIGLTPGEHTYKLTMPVEYGNGFDDAIGTFIIEEKKTTIVDADLNPIKEIGGNIVINSTPIGAEIFIDNIDKGVVTPYTEVGISPGTHTITLTLEGYEDWTGSVYINPGGMLFIFETLTPIS